MGLALLAQLCHISHNPCGGNQNQGFQFLFTMSCLSFAFLKLAISISSSIQLLIFVMFLVLCSSCSKWDYDDDECKIRYLYRPVEDFAKWSFQACAVWHNIILPDWNVSNKWLLKTLVLPWNTLASLLFLFPLTHWLFSFVGVIFSILKLA